MAAEKVPRSAVPGLEQAIADNDPEKFSWICIEHNLCGASVLPNFVPLVLHCVELNRPQLVENLLESNAFTHHPHPQTGEYPVHIALSHGYRDILNHIVKYAPWTLFSVCTARQSCLHYACAQGDADIVSFLCNEAFLNIAGEKQRLDANAPDINDRTPLHVAALGGNLDAVKALLDYRCPREDSTVHCVDVNAMEHEGRTALHLACMAQNTAVVKTLVGMTSSTDEWSWRKRCPVADLNFFDHFERTPLHYSAICGDVESAEALLRHGADVSAMAEPSAATCTMLVSAVTDSEVSDCFLEYGLSADAGDDVRSLLSSLELANVSAVHSQAKSSSNSSLSIVSDHFGDTGSSDSALLDDRQDLQVSSASASSGSSSQCTSYRYDATTADCHRSSSAQEVDNLSAMLHGSFRQAGSGTGHIAPGFIMAATGISARMRRKGVQYPKVSPLTEACVSGREDMVSLLLRYGAADDDKLAAKLTLYARKPDITEAMLCRCHKYLKRSRPGDQKQPEGLTSAEAGEDSRLPAAASVSWNGISMWSLDASWLRKVESLQNDVDPIATSHKLQPQYTPCVTLYEYSALSRATVLTSSAIVLLELHDNCLEKVPLALFQLEHLEALNLSSNRLRLLPTARTTASRASSRLSARERTNSTLNNSDVDHFQGWNCPQLAKLKLCDNKRLEALPNCVWFLPRLTVLEVQRAGLVSMPNFSKLVQTEIPVAPMLKILDIHDNCLDKVDGGLFHLPRLEQLNLSNNKLNDIPPQMWHAFSLKKLNLSRNRLARLPPLAKPFKELLTSPDGVPAAHADFYRQRLLEGIQREAARDFRSLPANLIRIDHDENQERPAFLAVKSYDESMSSTCEEPTRHLQSSYSTTAKPMWNQQDSLISQARMTSEEGSSPMILEDLDLSRNHFVSVPEVLACLAPRLRCLNLSNNYLCSLGPIGNIPSGLYKLNLSHCKISSGHSWDGALAKHQRCYLSSSVLGDDTTISHSSGGHAPAVVPSCSHRLHACLANLELLHLDHNRIVRISLVKDRPATSAAQSSGSPQSNVSSTSPEQPLKLFYPQLRELHVSHNHLIDVTPSIGYQENLSTLILSHNPRLRSMPPELGKLRGKLLKLGTEGLDLVFPSPMTHSPQALTSFLSFLKSTLTGSQQFRHMRLTVVGKSRRGKTTLLERLRGVPPTQLGPTEPTISIDMLDLVIPPPKGHGGGSDDKKSIVFHCWDFAGEESYYCLHQCFIFRRTLFLVVWKLSDGEAGVAEIDQWLVNIQSRAPGSPVLLVGTHLDQLPAASRKARSEELVAMATETYMMPPFKACHPQVTGVIVVSSTARRNHQIDELKSLIYNVASNLELRRYGTVKYSPTHVENVNLLLKHPIPASYLLMRERIIEATTAGYNGEKSVLTKEKFRQEFRACTEDEAEFEQAVSFCHFQGLILHYEEPALKNLYFLDPSWLCKVMARVICPDGGPRCRGLLAMADLRETLQNYDVLVTYILRLLEKFEVVTRLSDDLCLVPSQLDAFAESQVEERLSAALPMLGQTRPRGGSRAPSSSSFSSAQSYTSLGSTVGPMSFGASPQIIRDWRGAGTKSSALVTPASSVHFPGSITSVGESFQSSGQLPAAHSTSTDSCDPSEIPRPLTSLELVHNDLQHANGTAVRPVRMQISRLWVMDCFPSGFWPRLLRRLVSGSLSIDIMSYHLPLCELSKFHLEALVDEQGNAAGVRHGPLFWYCWSDRLELKWQDSLLLRLTMKSEASSTEEEPIVEYSECEIDGSHVMVLGNSTSSIQLDIFTNIWASFAAAYSSEGAGWQVAFSKPAWAGDEFYDLAGRISASWMSRITQSISVLASDWFHGVFRAQDLKCVLPCPMCLEGSPSHSETVAWFRAAQSSHKRAGNAKRRDSSAGEEVHSASSGASREYCQPQTGAGQSDANQSQNPRNGDDLPLFLQADTVNCYRLSSLVYLIQQCQEPNSNKPAKSGGEVGDNQSQGLVQCPKHGFLPAAELAPDLTFEDLSSKQLLSLSSSHKIQTDKMILGVGGQGVVFKGRLKQNTHCLRSVALKFFHWDTKALKKKMPSGPVELRSMFADRPEDAWTSYESLRQEVNMLLCISHPHILSMVGVSSSPHCVVLDFAPLGNLRLVYDVYRNAGMRMGNFTTRQLAYQVASALAYLHDRSIVYRDMKSDNILAFSFPSPTNSHDAYYNLVNVKLTDHGISRTGGLALRVEGTAGFIAPEVLSHRGHEPYGPKVDVFAYGMFLFEIMAMEKPFSAMNDAHANCAVMKKERPLWTPEVGHAPVCAQDVMMQCWRQDPDERPTMDQVLSMIKQPTFARVLNALYFEECFTILDACVVTAVPDNGAQHADKDNLHNIPEDTSQRDVLTEIWVCGGSRDCGVAAVLNLDTYKVWYCKVCDNRVTCVGSVGNTVWIGTSTGFLCIYDVLTRQRLFYGVIAVGRYALQITHCPISACVLVAVSDKTLRSYKDKLQFSPGHEEGTLETLSVSFMPSRWSICCFALVPDPKARSLAKARCSSRLDVWCGLDAGHVMVYDLDYCRWKEEVGNRGSFQRAPSPHTVKDDEPALLQERESLQLPFHGNQPCSFVCVTQFEDSPRTASSSSLRTRVWLAVRRRSVVACWTYGSVRWSPFDMAVYLRSAEVFQARVTSMTSWKHEVYVGTGSGNVVILDAQRMCCTSSLSMHGGPVRRILSLPPHTSMRYTSGLRPPQVPSPHSESEGGSAELHCHDSLAHPSVRDPFCLSGPAMTGHTALDVFLHTRQTLGYGAAMTGDMTRQPCLSRQTSVVDSQRPGDSLRSTTTSPPPQTASTPHTAPGTFYEDPLIQPCIDVSKLHLMFSCDEQLIPVSGATEGGRDLNRAPVFMMTWLAGEWGDNTELQHAS